MGILAQVVMPMQSGLPKDVVVNDFAIGGLTPSSSPADWTAVKDAITGIYQDHAYGGGSYSLGSRLAPCLSRSLSAVAVKYYDITNKLDGRPHGSPIDVTHFTLEAAIAADGLPEEVALVATLEAAGRLAQLVETSDGTDADSAPDRPRERYTGRVYFGPWGTPSTTSDAQKFARPAGQDNLVQAHVARQAAAILSGTSSRAYLGVWSRKDAVIRGIDSVATDNAWDTQRRRGAAPSSRTRTAVTGASVLVELAV